VATPVLFFAGGAFVYFLVMPMAWQFFAQFEQTAATNEAIRIQLMPKVSEYFSLVLQLIFAFGICFETPVLLGLLARAGLATSKGLASKRRYAIVIIFIIAAVITPPDVISQLALAFPMCLLYEVGILVARRIEKQKAAQEAAFEAELRDEPPAAEKKPTA
jgi:sec-independent protein translocase protein TatC